MEEIDLTEVYEYFKKKIGIIVVVVLLFGILGFVYSNVYKVPLYQSYTTVILGSNTSLNTENINGITQSEITLNKNLVDTYTEIIKSRRVLDQVINRLNLNIEYEDLCDQISVSSLKETEIIKIMVTDTNNQKAQQIADCCAEVFITEVVELYNINNVNILDKANEVQTPYNINLLKEVVIFILIGFVLVVGIIFIIYYFDRTIKSKEQVESKINLPLLGTVEEIRGGKNER